LTPPGAPRTLLPMIHGRHPRTGYRWLLTIMATLLVLGHVCELPAYADLVSPWHSTDDASTDSHEHEAELSCDPVNAVSNTSSLVQVRGPLLEITQALPVVSSVPGWLATLSSIENSTRLPSRPPLFVLYASLLI
jgi:hypothetical protein